MRLRVLFPMPIRTLSTYSISTLACFDSVSTCLTTLFSESLSTMDRSLESDAMDLVDPAQRDDPFAPVSLDSLKGVVAAIHKAVKDSISDLQDHGKITHSVSDLEKMLKDDKVPNSLKDKRSLQVPKELATIFQPQVERTMHSCEKSLTEILLNMRRAQLSSLNARIANPRQHLLQYLHADGWSDLEKPDHKALLDRIDAQFKLKLSAARNLWKAEEMSKAAAAAKQRQADAKNSAAKAAASVNVDDETVRKVVIETATKAARDLIAAELGPVFFLSQLCSSLLSPV